MNLEILPQKEIRENICLLGGFIAILKNKISQADYVEMMKYLNNIDAIHKKTIWKPLNKSRNENS